ncbi:MAG: ankyrin repeat domain-containing protein [Spirochaetales bacterium]|nr:MAG: ankyrin repeat domain-containing protein [Spirochaetales bacterium]
MKKLLILNLVLASAGIVFAQDFFELLATGTPGQVRTAIKAGLDVNADLGDGYTSLMIAAAYNTNPEVITILLKAGANVNFQMRDGKTP